MSTELGQIIGSIGVGMSAIGTIGSSIFAGNTADLQGQQASADASITKQINNLYARQADINSRAAKATAKILQSSTSQENDIITQVTQTINDLRAQQVIAQNQQADASNTVQAANFQQMQLDAQRNKRDIIRNALITKSTAIAGAVASGGQGGSGLAGGLAGVSNQAGYQTKNENQNLGIGNIIAQANIAYTNAGSVANQLGAQAETAQNSANSQLSVIENNTNVKQAQSTARFQDRYAATQKGVLALQTKLDQVNSQYAVQEGQSQSNQSTFGGIASLGASLLQGAISLF